MRLSRSATSHSTRVALYGRVSTVDQRTDLQLDGLRSLAEQRGWEVVGEFIDVGVSGARTKRPQLDAMLREVSLGKVDIVCCWKLDRLGRSTRDLLNLLEELRVRNVQLVSAQEALDTSTAMGRAFYTLIALLGEVEREWLRDRTRAGLESARRRGARIGRPRAQVNIVRARQLFAEGHSLRSAAAVLGVNASTLMRAVRRAADPAVAEGGLQAAP
jgi:DNA invertase Pin-like site-specific DNA recombinase